MGYCLFRQAYDQTFPISHTFLWMFQVVDVSGTHTHTHNDKDNKGQLLTACTKNLKWYV